MGINLLETPVRRAGEGNISVPIGSADSHIIVGIAPVSQSTLTSREHGVPNKANDI